MKLRIAKKIWASIGTDDCRYNNRQISQSRARMERTREFAEDLSFIQNLMSDIGKSGRAYLLRNSFPARSLELLLEAEDDNEPQLEWAWPDKMAGNGT